MPRPIRSIRVHFARGGTKIDARPKRVANPAVSPSALSLLLRSAATGAAFNTAAAGSES